MATSLAPARSARGLNTLRLIARTSPSTLQRAFVSTLPQNPHVYVHPNTLPSGEKQYLYTYLPTTPPNASLAIATSPTNPPEPETLKENPDFLELLHAVVKEHAVHDPEVKAQAAMYASQAGSALGSGGSFFPNQNRRRTKAPNTPPGGGGGAAGDGAGGASAQGGMGGAGRGGFVHISDQRNPPDWGRVAWPEDILGSLEVDGKGGFVEPGGRYQRSGTYRVCTREGFLGLSEYLRDRVKAELKRIAGG